MLVSTVDYQSPVLLLTLSSYIDAATRRVVEFMDTTRIFRVTTEGWRCESDLLPLRQTRPKSLLQPTDATVIGRSSHDVPCRRGGGIDERNQKRRGKRDVV